MRHSQRWYPDYRRAILERWVLCPFLLLLALRCLLCSTTVIRKRRIKPATKEPDLLARVLLVASNKSWASRWRNPERYPLPWIPTLPPSLNHLISISKLSCASFSRERLASVFSWLNQEAVCSSLMPSLQKMLSQLNELSMESGVLTSEPSASLECGEAVRRWKPWVNR